MKTAIYARVSTGNGISTQKCKSASFVTIARGEDGKSRESTLIKAFLEPRNRGPNSTGSLPMLIFGDSMQLFAGASIASQDR